MTQEHFNRDTVGVNRSSGERPDSDVRHPEGTAPKNPGVGGQQNPSTKGKSNHKGGGY